MNTQKAQQNLANYRRALAALTRSLVAPITEERDLGVIIKAFEIVFKLAWKSLKRILADDGQETAGPKDVLVKAFSFGYIDQQDIWLSMIDDRNATVHTYNQKFAEAMVGRIRGEYVAVFSDLEKRVSK